MKCQIKVKNNYEFYKLLDSLNISSEIYPSINNTYVGALNYKDKLQLENSVKTLSINSIPFPKLSEKLFFNNKIASWTRDSTGNIRIPQKGMKLHLDEDTYGYYIKTINQYEGIYIKRNDNQYFINGLKVASYTFKNNYVFVLGDNRDNSLDSRFKGFVPYYLIVGTVNIVL